jgi:hypothetical protein
MYWRVPTIAPLGGQPFASIGRPSSTAMTRRPARWRSASPKVEQLHARPGQHDVPGLQVPVHDAAAVRLVERVGDLDRVLELPVPAAAVPAPAACCSVSPSMCSITR